ncbi:TPA: restriction endonuclease subunit S [Proteus mirabilis]|uniref:restriction endonuclease subunit S n=1 Tax=Proteus mirabilis TaxID=584 RepID=UPI00390864FE
MSNGISKTDLNLIPAGYKQTEVGVIPEDWKVKSIGEIASIFSGGTPNRKIPEYWDGDIPWVTTTLIDGTEIDSAREFITQRGLENSSTNWCKAGTILLAMYGQGKTRGKAAILSIDATINQACVAIELKDICSSHYILHILNSMYEEIRELSNSGSQENLSAGIIKSIQIPFPPKKEQITIANALSDVDLLISELEKLIAKKQAIKTATMQQLLTGHTRLPQFALREDGSKKGTKQSELGEIPEDWEILAMGDLGSTYGGLSGKSKQDFGHGNSLYVPFTNVMANVVVDIDNLEKVDVRETQNNLALGDLLFNGSSETPEEVCFSALVSADISKLYLNSFCFGFRSNQKNAYLPLYLAYWFRSEVGRAAVLVMAQGSTRYNISKSQFMKLPIVLPDTEEQTAIATILSDMDEDIQALEQRLSKTRQIKQGMMQELLTGKTRLVQPSPTDVCHVD